MSAVIKELRREHGNIAKLLNALDRQLAVFEEGHRPDYEIVEAITDYFLSYPDLYHHPKENIVLARLKERSPAAAARVGDLQREHEELAARTREFAKGVRAVLDEAEVPRAALDRWARNFIDYQRHHMEHEEAVFFPIALEHLTDADWDELESRMTDEDDPLFGDDVGERYKALHAEILEWERESEAG